MDETLYDEPIEKMLHDLTTTLLPNLNTAVYDQIQVLLIPCLAMLALFIGMKMIPKIINRFAR